MDDLLNQILQIGDCNFRVFEYSPIHSVLTLLATNRATDKKFRLVFGLVEYVEMPMFWKGKFTLASDDEYILLSQKSEFECDFKKYPVAIYRKSIDLYKVERSRGAVFILGHISSIEEDD